MRKRVFLIGSIAAIVAVAIAVALLWKKPQTKEFWDPHEHIPYVKVFFAPLDGISELEAEKLADEFYEKFGKEVWPGYDAGTLKHSITPDTCLNESRTRFRAKKMLHMLQERYGAQAKANVDKFEDGEYFIVGVTDKDISTNRLGHDDYGILGLSYLGSSRVKACVISTYRLKRRKDLWKLAAHEFSHGFFGLPHCPNNDPHCIMCDAKGGNPHFEIKDSLCSDCANNAIIFD